MENANLSEQRDADPRAFRLSNHTTQFLEQSLRIRPFHVPGSRPA